jgi:lipopolysaccharide export system protein LptC
MTQAADIMRGKRRAFASPNGFHDRLIRFLATALPALIGVVAAVMILTPLSPRGEISFLLDRNKIAIAKERIRVASATYRGRDNQGRGFLVAAGSAVQNSAQDRVVRMRDMVASLALPDGEARISAPDGTYDYDREMVHVDGPVSVSAASGYRMSARNISIDLDRRRITGAGGIEGAVPTGTFSANRIEADLAERTVALEGNARLQMIPGKLRMP